MKGNTLRNASSFLALCLCCTFCKGGEHIRCNATYEKIGCFKRNAPYLGAKLFGTLVMTDRDWSSKRYGGQEIDWFNWASYIHGFYCRCWERLQQLTKDKKKIYHHLSLSNYGECWTSEDIVYDLTKLGLAETCVGDDFLSCRQDVESECFGAADSQFVYHVYYEDEPIEDELELLNSQCSIETLTICTTPSTSYITSTVQP